MIKRVQDGYKAFVEKDMETLKNYFTDDCEMNPQFPVKGWQPVKGFSAMMTNENPGVPDFTQVPYNIEVLQNHNGICQSDVYEDITTKYTIFKGMAIHHYNNDGKCFLVEPYHDSAKMTITNSTENNIQN